VGDLRRHLAVAVPEGPWLYPEDQLTDLPQRLLAAETTREQIFLQLHQELPYATMVETDTWEERDDGSVSIAQTIHVQRDSQKAIVLGKGGRQIKEIGARARAELERVLGRRVHLFLFVRVSGDWTEDRERYKEMGLDFES
jgi:GTPase